ncbi:MAG TPA: dUTP diphosphatase [Syntrophales bacterium]|nr:dUTP diphosphatase [Syntrophales bacterium]
METITVSVEKLPGCDDIELPRYMTECAAGMDIFAAVTEPEILRPGERKMIPTGIRIALPAGYEAQIRPRSGLAIRNGVTLLNTPGTIDADYRGEIGVIMINHGREPFEVKRGDRIAQMTVHRVCRVSWQSTPSLDPTIRGEGGFGHTG